MTSELNPLERNPSLAGCHPAAYDKFVLLAELLSSNAAQRGRPLFLPFEAYRSPERQEQLYREGTTKAHAWQSAHQWGMAVDFVPYINGAWTWDAPDDWWTYLLDCSRHCGLDVPIVWDKVHVESPLWIEARARLRKK